ncbi:FAD-binding oxidoreductase [Actinocatenispora thailandica]|uniref:FAD-binding oxidoreductase n=1 Tax=Actinocatenispora thailandica TaxID=227318 RepID=UPI00194FFC8A|nr:FAD-binding oxidoreductase [Actinocatenispora thailandica]
MSDLTSLRAALDGAALVPGDPGYEAIRRPANPAYRRVRPRLVVRCRSERDVVRAVRYAKAHGHHLVPRGGGHCFAGRSSTDGMVLDLSGLAGIAVAPDGLATIGAGARLGQVYAELHAAGRTLPAGCGATVGIAGLTLGGGIGLLGREYGLTCDRLVGARVVLADGSVVDCDADREPELFWALRGAGGGQFGVLTSLRFDTIAEPVTTRIEAHWPLGDTVAAWQEWAPDAPEQLTLNLTVVAEPGTPARAVLFGAATLDAGTTRGLLREFTGRAGAAAGFALRAGLPYHRVKGTLADPREAPGRAVRIRSEFFARPMTGGTVAALLGRLGVPGGTDRRLALTAMGGAYDRVAGDATAFAHRGQRFLLEHVGEPDDPWVDDSWTTAHRDGSGRVYPNFPDPALHDWAVAYHAGNLARLAAVKNSYDPGRFFDFPQSV